MPESSFSPDLLLTVGVDTAQLAQQLAQLQRELNVQIGAVGGAQPLQQGLRQVRSELERLPVSARAAASTFETAMGRQEAAIFRARQALLNLNAAIARTGADRAIIDRSTTAFLGLETALSRGALSAASFTTAQRAWQASLGEARREIAAVQATRFNEFLSSMTTASILAVGPLSGIGARLAALSHLSAQGTLGLGLMVGGTTALALGLVKLTSEGLQAAMAFERIENSLRVATVSGEAARAEYEFLLDVSKRLGLDLQNAALQFSKLAAATRGTSLT